MNQHTKGEDDEEEEREKSAVVTLHSKLPTTPMEHTFHFHWKIIFPRSKNKQEIHTKFIIFHKITYKK